MPTFHFIALVVRCRVAIGTTAAIAAGVVAKERSDFATTFVLAMRLFAVA